MIFAKWKGPKCQVAILCAAGACLLAPARVIGSTPSLRKAQEMLQDLDRARLEAAGNRARRAGFKLRSVNRHLTAIQAVVNEALAPMLDVTPRPNCEVLQKELRSALGRGRPDPNVASVLCPRRSQTYYAVGYDLTEGPVYSRSWIGVFGPPANGNGYRVLASAEDTLPSKTVALAPLPRGPHGELRFLAHGVNWGDPHSRLTVIAYSFNGHKIKELWSRAELPEGTVRAQGNRIELSFLNMAVGPGFSGVHEVSQVYLVTATAVALESTSAGPNSSGVKPPPGTKRLGAPRGASRGGSR